MLDRSEKDSPVDEDLKFEFVNPNLKLGPDGQPLVPQPSSDPADPLVSALFDVSFSLLFNSPPLSSWA